MKRILSFIVCLFLLSTAIVACRAESAISAQPNVSVAGNEPRATQPVAINLVARASPDTAQRTQDQTRQAEYNGITISFPSAVARRIQGTVQPAVPPSDGPFWTVTPEHTRFTFDGYTLAGTDPEPQINIYAVADYEHIQPNAATTIDELQQILNGKPVPTDSSLPLLPLINARQMLHADVMNVSFQNGRGIRYVTEYSQGIVPVNNHEAFYTFQGLTADDRYYVSAMLPVSNPLFAPNSQNIPGGDVQAFAANYTKYLSDLTQKMDATPSSSFSPDLTVLDAMIKSLKVTPAAVKPTSGTPTAEPSADQNSGKSILGVVLYGSRPVPGARVQLIRYDTNVNTWVVFAETAALGDGSFVIKNPPVGDYIIAGLFPDQAQGNPRGESVSIKPGQEITGLRVVPQRNLKLVEPQAGVLVSTTPTLSWESWPDAKGYRVFVIDAGTTALAADKTVAGTSFKLSGLTPGRTYQYDVHALGANNTQLAFVIGEFKVEGVDPAPISDGSETEGIPPNCLTRGLSTKQYVNHKDNYCLMYPSRFSPGKSDSGETIIDGPALDQSADPLFARLTVIVRSAKAGSDLNSEVDEALKEYAGMNVPAMTRQNMTLGGEPAIMVERVPGRLASRVVFLQHHDTLYRVEFWPLQVPVAQRDVEELYLTVTTTFSFLDSIP